MSHERLYGKQIHAIFIQVGAESIAEGMTGDFTFPSQPVLICMDMSGKKEGVNGSVLSILLREEAASWLSVCKPVLCQ